VRLGDTRRKAIEIWRALAIDAPWARFRYNAMTVSSHGRSERRVRLREEGLRSRVVGERGAIATEYTSFHRLRELGDRSGGKEIQRRGPRHLSRVRGKFRHRGALAVLGGWIADEAERPPQRCALKRRRALWPKSAIA